MVEGEKSTHGGKGNPLATANILSKMFFLYVSPILSVANISGDVTPNDLFECLPQDSSCFQSQKILSEWQREIERATDKGRRPSLLKAILRTYGPWYGFLAIGAVTEELLRVSQPILIGLLIDYFSVDSGVERSRAFIYAGLIALDTLLLALVHGPYFWALMRLGMNMRVALSTAVYQKVLRLSNKSLQSATTGKVNNVMTSDVSRFDRIPLFLHYLWLGPLEAVVIMFFLYREIGWACLPGYAIMIILIPFQGWLGKLFAKLRRKTAQFTDRRIAVMTEIITSMRVIKVYAWEKAFGEVIRQIRRCEIRKVVTASYAAGTNLGLSRYGNRLLDVGMVAVYAITTAEQIRVSTVFIVISFCRMIAYAVMNRTPKSMQGVSEVLVAVRRIEEILLLDEKVVSKAAVSVDLPKNVQIEAKGVYCSWREEEAHSDTLKDLSFEVKKGQLTAIVGPVGCGKSSLLMTIIKELPVRVGSLKLGGSVSFAAQQPWVFSGTVRDNILFGKEYDEDKLNNIIRVCALNQDLEILSDGDLTLIGERGVTLSGGQKARINLARSLYEDSDVILLDDPLSAVDSHVGRHIFDECIMGHLADKSRILVTHQLQYLTTADQIIVLKDGHIEGKGTLDELISLGIDFAKLMETDDDDDVDSVLSEPSASISEKRKETSNIEKATEGNTSQKVFKEEAKHKGDVGWSVYWKYFTYGTNWLGLILLVFFMVSTQVVYILTDYWLALWTDLEEAKTANLTDISDELIFGSWSPTTEIAVLVYGMMVLGLLVFGLIRAFLCLQIMIRASRNLHNRMFAAVVRCPLLFFDTNPVGRIQNRFTKDVGVMDDQLPVNFFDMLQLLLQIVAVVILNAVINYYTLIVIIPLFILFVLLRRYSVNATRPLKRLDGVTRSPVFSHTTSTIFGLSTIRAYNKESQFLERFYLYQDHHTEAMFAYNLVNRWFGLRLDILSAFFTSGVSFAAILAGGNLEAGLVGVILNNTIVLSTIFQFAVRQTAVVENQMTSVERAIEYTKLQPEAPLTNPEKKPPADWPGKGDMALTDVSLKYSAHSPTVLQNITCEIQAKEKIGIVGRTGAGKSSLITALFRLSEPTGDIRIDNVSCLDLGLHDLRKNLSIIPQDPVLFKGSLKRNLDPFNKYTDEHLWNALKDVQLHQALKDKPAKLEMDVGIGGTNFSVGQRQLICLARAIVKNNRILILDEATANVDPRTDSLIQETIRTKFEDCTVLTIAHRLNTIMDSDRIMVLDAGQLREFDHPHILLQDKNSLLSHLVDQTGRQEAGKLATIARNNFNRDEGAGDGLHELPTVRRDSGRSKSREDAPNEGVRTTPEMDGEIGSELRVNEKDQTEVVEDGETDRAGLTQDRLDGDFEKGGDVSGRDSLDEVVVLVPIDTTQQEGEQPNEEDEDTQVQEPLLGAHPQDRQVHI